MKTSRKSFTINNCALSVFLLGRFVCNVCCSSETPVSISTPPEDITVCRGNKVNVSCGYSSANALPVTWVINGTPFTGQQVKDSPLCQLNNPTSPMTFSLTVLSINDTTKLMCTVHLMANIVITSRSGTVTVIDKPVIKITRATGGCGYVSVSWIADNADDEACCIVKYDITLSSMSISTKRASSILTNSYSFTGLSDECDDTSTVFNVTVFGINLKGKTVNFDSILVRTMILSSTMTALSTTLTVQSTTTLTSTPPSSDSGGSNSDKGGGGSSAGAIAGGVIGGIVAVFLVIIIIVIYFIFYKNNSKGSSSDDKAKLKRSHGTNGTYEGEINVHADNNVQSDNVVYAAPTHTVIVPHQTSNTGVLYAVSTKTESKKSQEQPLQEQYQPDTKKSSQGVMYADLQMEPAGSEDKNVVTTRDPAIAYAELLM